MLSARSASESRSAKLSVPETDSSAMTAPLARRPHGESSQGRNIRTFWRSCNGVHGVALLCAPLHLPHEQHPGEAVCLTNFSAWRAEDEQNNTIESDFDSVEHGGRNVGDCRSASALSA